MENEKLAEKLNHAAGGGQRHEPISIAIGHEIDGFAMHISVASDCFDPEQPPMDAGGQDVATYFACKLREHAAALTDAAERLSPPTGRTVQGPLVTHPEAPTPEQEAKDTWREREAREREARDRMEE